MGVGESESENLKRAHRFRASICSHVTALEPVDRLRENKRTQLTALRSSPSGQRAFITRLQVASLIFWGIWS